MAPGLDEAEERSKHHTLAEYSGKEGDREEGQYEQLMCCRCFSADRADVAAVACSEEEVGANAAAEDEVD